MILLCRDRTNGPDVGSIVQQLIAVIKQHRCNPALAVQRLLLFKHGIEPADRVPLQPGHGAAFVQDEYQFRQILFHRVSPPLSGALSG